MTVPPPSQLPEEMNEEIFRGRIVPAFLTGPPARDNPVVVIVGGQTGAGKTEMTKMVRRALGGPGEYTNIDMDLYNPMHPGFTRWQAEDPATASAKVRPDGELWWTKAQRYAIEQRQNVVLESAMRDPSEFEDIAAAFRGGGYRVEVALAAVPSALSRLGVLSRYHDEVETSGQGRYVSPAGHDACYEGVLRGAAAVDAGGLADAAFAFRRSGAAVYANHADADGTWRAPAGLAAAVEQERQRPWTDAERAAYQQAMARERARGGDEWRPELDAVDRLAAPLLRDGTPGAGPPADTAQRRALDEADAVHPPTPDEAEQAADPTRQQALDDAVGRIRRAREALDQVRAHAEDLDRPGPAPSLESGAEPPDPAPEREAEPG
ncbi:zeta toxin family protein [Dactylosporangium sp. NPDC005555]|uniref:zeta toxin family protein n=1 Tax=Dactylosporangium sp. NPDC005555 TaxID=3154889 RepID=UPI0033A63ABF